MRIAYLDCFAGVSGDLLLGAIIDAGVSLDQLRTELSKLSLPGWSIDAERVTKQGIAGTQVRVTTEESAAHRNLADIVALLVRSQLDQAVRDRAADVFRRLAEAEAKAHGAPVEEVHFHEVGAVDAIVDVVGTVVGLRLLGIEHLTCSPIPTGTGFVDCAHGRLPVPAPGTAELLRGLPTYGGGIEAELTTPTGAALVSTLCDEFSALPLMTMRSVGYGAGTYDLPIPNLLRLFIGEPAAPLITEQLSIIETNIDDLNPELYEPLLERLLAAGALDVFLTPIVMKKNRPGTLVTVLCERPRVNDLTAIILAETTTFGLRISEVERRCLEREWIEVDTQFGRARAKLGQLAGRVITIAPEYEGCRKLANEHRVPVRQVYGAVQAAAREKLG